MAVILQRLGNELFADVLDSDHRYWVGNAEADVFQSPRSVMF